MLKTLTLAAALLAGTALASFAEEPRSGGVVNFTAPYGSSFSSLDMQSTPQTQDELWGIAVHRSLYRWDSDTNTPVLELASSVDVSEDGLVYTYKLLDNAVFHNDKPMTADDIIWSYERIAKPSNAFPGAYYFAAVAGIDEYASGAAEHISGLKKIDDHTLEITLTEAIDPSFLLMRTNAAIIPVDADKEADFATHPIGLGPFKFVEHIPGARITAEKWDKYYKAGKPYVDKVNVFIMEDASARDVAFRNKEIDVSVLGPTQYEAYQADPDLSKGILEVAEVYTRNVGFNPTYEPFSHVEVRQAFNHAINSDLIIEKLAKGKAYRASGWLPITSPAFDPNTPPYDYNPEKAKELAGRSRVSRWVRVRIDRNPERKLGHHHRRGDHPDAGRGRYQGRGQAGGKLGSGRGDPGG